MKLSIHNLLQIQKRGERFLSRHWQSTLAGFFLFLGSLYANSQAILFAKRDTGNATTDIILDNIPVINTDIIFSEGAILFVLFIFVLLFFHPRAIPATLKSVALLIYTRSLFVILTHLAPYPSHIETDLHNFRYVTAGSDLFFSGHTALPFLFALLFWHKIAFRWLFLFTSVVAALAVLFGHLHYSIDVFSAYFITYGVYIFTTHVFPKDFSYWKDHV